MSASATDSMIRRLEGEFEERNAFIQGLATAAEDGNRDLNKQEMELIADARSRIADLSQQITPLRETSKIAIESRNRMRDRCRVDRPAQPAHRRCRRVSLGGRLHRRHVLRSTRRP